MQQTVGCRCDDGWVFCWSTEVLANHTEPQVPYAHGILKVYHHDDVSWDFFSHYWPLLWCESWMVASTHRQLWACNTTGIWYCHKPLNQWQCSFQWKLHCHWLRGFQHHHHLTIVIQGPVMQILNGFLGSGIKQMNTRLAGDNISIYFSLPASL